MFDKRAVSAPVALDQEEALTGKSVSRIILPTVYSCMLSGSDGDGAGQQRTIPVYFRAPRRSASRSTCAWIAEKEEEDFA